MSHFECEMSFKSSDVTDFHDSSVVCEFCLVHFLSRGVLDDRTIKSQDQLCTAITFATFCSQKIFRHVVKETTSKQMRVNTKIPRVSDKKGFIIF